MTTERWGYRGYVSCREFGGLRMPVPVQSVMLRDYCARNGLIYKLHVNENEFPHSYMVLEGMVSALEGLQGILVFSMFMLPKRAERRHRIYERVLGAGVEFHLVLEDFVIRKPADVTPVEEILSTRALLPYCPAGVPDDPHVWR